MITQIDNQLVITPYPALLYPIIEALPPRHATVRRHPSATAAEASAPVPFAASFDIGGIGSSHFGVAAGAGRGPVDQEEKKDSGGSQVTVHVGYILPSLLPFFLMLFLY